MTKRIISVMLALLMICALVPMSALQTFAAQTDSVSVGGDGEDEYPELNLSGVTKAAFKGGDYHTTFIIKPTVSKTYKLYTTADMEICGDLYTTDWEWVNETEYGCYDLTLYAELEAGKEYLLRVYKYDEYMDSGEDYEFDIYSEEADPVESLVFSQGESRTGYPDTSFYLNAYAYPEDAYYNSVTWASTDDSVASVSSYGAVYLNSPGEAVISATLLNGVSAQMTVTVIEPETITLNQTKNVSVTDSFPEARFAFTAPETRCYQFSFFGDDDYVGEILDSDMYTVDNTEKYDEYGMLMSANLEEGETYLFCASLNDSASGEFEVTVTEAALAEEITITPNDIMGFTGTWQYFEVGFLPEDSAEEEYVITSSDESVATAGHGYVYLVAPGEAEITATSANGLTATCNVTVNAYNKIKDGDELEVTLYGTSDEAIFEMTPEVSGTYIFKSKGESYVFGEICDSEMSRLTSDSFGGEYGNFYFTQELEAGETYYVKAHLMYTNNTETFTLCANLAREAESVKLYYDFNYGYIGEYIGFIADVTPEDSYAGDIEWTSSNEDVAVFDGPGIIKLVSAGTSVITATTDNGKSDSVTVTSLEAEMINPGDTKTVEITDEFELVAFKFVPEESGDYIFQSLNGSYLSASICNSDFGMIRGQMGHKINMKQHFEAGFTYYFKCAYNQEGMTGSYDVSLTRCPEAEEMTISPDENITGFVGATSVLSVNFLPVGSESQNVTWSTSDDDIASITDYDSQCYVNFRSVGTATITATSENGLTATATVTVKDYETLSAGEHKTVKIENKGDSYIFKIVPPKDDYYSFWSKTTKDTCCELFDSEWDSIDDNDDGGEGNNFRLNVMLKKDKTYYLKVRFYDDQITGSFPVYAGTIAYITELEAVSAPDQLTYVEGYIDGYINLEGLALRATWSDGVVTDWEYSEDEDIRGENIDCGVEDGKLYVTCGDESVWFELNIIQNNVESIEIVKGIDETLTEETDGYWTYGYNEDTEAYDRYYFRYYEPSLKDVEVQINYTDGSSVTANIDDVVDGYKVKATSNQSYEPWTVGSDNIIKVKYLGAEADLHVTVNSSPVDSIEVIEDPGISCAENCGGYWDTYYNEDTHQNERYYHYEPEEIYDIKVRINFKDGTSEEAYVGDTVRENKIYIKNTQDDHHFTVGGDNKLYIAYLNAQTTVPVTITENPVKSVKIIQQTSFTLYENMGGYTDKYYDNETGEYVEFYCYNLSVIDDARVQITFKDGTSKMAYAGDYVRNERIEIFSDQYTTPFTIGANFYTVSYMGVEAKGVIFLAENPVKSVEVLDNYSVTLYENTDGYWTTMDDPDTGETIEYFRYYTPDVDDADVLITYKDNKTALTTPYGEVKGYDVYTYTNQEENPWTVGGENNFVIVEYAGQKAMIPINIVPSPVESLELVTHTASTLIENADGYWSRTDDPDGGMIFYYYVNDISDAVVKINYKDGTSRTAHVGERVDGYYLSYEENVQYTTPWTLGGNNLLTISYMGASVDMPISVVESPVESLTLNSAPTRQYVYGDEFYGGNDYFSPDDYTGLSFTVNFKDGSHKTYTSDDISGRYIDGHRFTVTCDNEQTVGSMPVTFGYMGKTLTYNVQVKENTLKSLEIVKLPDDPNYSQYYGVNFAGTQIKFTYTDGSSYTLTLDDSNIIYGYYPYAGTYIGFEYNGVTGIIRQTETDTAGAKVRVFYADLSDEKEGLVYTERSKVIGVEVENFSLTAENMLLKIDYAGNYSDELLLDDIKFCGFVMGKQTYNVRAMTNRGLLSFQIMNPDVMDTDEYGIMYIFGQTVYDKPKEEYKQGDANGDGEVDVNDAMLVQRYISKLSVPSQVQILKYCDINHDGIVSVSDVTLIQKYAAGMPVIYSIGVVI